MATGRLGAAVTTQATRVTAVLVAYGSTPLLVEAVDRLLASSGVDVDVVVVDNGSSDGSLGELASRRSTRVITAGSNLGFGGGANLGVAESDAPFVAFVNPDVLVECDALRRLTEVAAEPSCGIASASVRLLSEPELLNSSGGAIHFLGLGWAMGYREPATSVVHDRDVMAASGAAMVMRRDRFLELGGFTDELFMYHEDAELSLRCWLRGWSVRYTADAVALHDYEFGRNPRKLYFLERNRLILVLTCYSTRMLALLALPLVVYEIGMIAVALGQGWGREKVDGWMWIARHRGWIGKRRREVQAERRVSDSAIRRLFAARFAGAAQFPMPRALEPANRLLGAYWRAVSRLL